MYRTLNQPKIQTFLSIASIVDRLQIVPIQDKLIFFPFKNSQKQILKATLMPLPSMLDYLLQQYPYSLLCCTYSPSGNSIGYRTTLNKTQSAILFPSFLFFTKHENPVEEHKKATGSSSQDGSKMRMNFSIIYKKRKRRRIRTTTSTTDVPIIPSFPSLLFKEAK